VILSIYSLNYYLWHYLLLEEGVTVTSIDCINKVGSQIVRCVQVLARLYKKNDCFYKIAFATRGRKQDFCIFEAQKYQEVSRSAKKYREVPRSTEKCQEVFGSIKKYQEVSRSIKKYQEIQKSAFSSLLISLYLTILVNFYSLRNIGNVARRKYLATLMTHLSISVFSFLLGNY
jgi:hypothetical protein